MATFTNNVNECDSPREKFMVEFNRRWTTHDKDAILGTMDSKIRYEMVGERVWTGIEEVKEMLTALCSLMFSG